MFGLGLQTTTRCLFCKEDHAYVVGTAKGESNLGLCDRCLPKLAQMLAGFAANYGNEWEGGDHEKSYEKARAFVEAFKATFWETYSRMMAWDHREQLEEKEGKSREGS
jgi:hypothetical protein